MFKEYSGPSIQKSAAYFSAVLLTMGLNIDLSHAAEKGEAGLPQLNFSTYSSQIFWLVVTFVFLYIVFSKKTLPSISEVLERRRETIMSDLETAENLRAEAEEIQQEYEKNIADAHADASNLLQSLQTEISAEMNAELEKFKAESQSKIDNAEKSAHDLKNRMLADIESQLPEITAEIVEKVSDIKVKKADAEEALSNLQDLKAQAA